MATKNSTVTAPGITDPPAGGRSSGAGGTASDHNPSGTVPEMSRIGEVAKLTGVTTRTLRYWEEQDLLLPSSYGAGGERMYSPADVARVTRIRNLQELLGFSLAEVRAVLNTEDIGVLDRVRSELWSETVPPARRRALLEEGLTANDQLVARLEDTLARIQAFRDERIEAGTRLQQRLQEARAELAAEGGDLAG